MELKELGKRKNKKQKRLDKDLSTITYYNCNKKRHYANTCLDLSKN